LRSSTSRLARGSPGRIQCQFPGKATPVSAHAPTMPQEARSSLAYPNVRGRRLRHVLGQPDDAASLAEGDQRSVELVWREVQGIAAPPVPIAPPKPRADCDVSLAVSVAYLHPNLAVGASRPGGHLLEQLRDSVKLESHPIKSRSEEH